MSTDKEKVKALQRLDDDGYMTYQVIVGIFPAVTPLLSIVDLQQQPIGHIHVLCGSFLSAQTMQH